MSEKSVRIWYFIIAVYVGIIVVIGGITRLTRSGLSITEWKPITGIVPPSSEQEWKRSFELYKQTPEYKKVNSHFTLADYKKIYFWEFIHRLVARSTAFLLLFPYLWFIWKKKLSHKDHLYATILFALGLFQGVLGWLMVKSGMVKNPAVSHYRLAAHLISAFVIGSAAFWFALGNLQGIREQLKKHWPLVAIFLVQIVYGAFTAGLKAGYLYGTWPKMGPYWVPPEAWEGSFWHNLVENPVTVQWIHRTFAWVVFFSIAYSVLRTRIKAGYWLLFVVCVQILLGIFTLTTHVSHGLAVKHQLTAYVLVLSLWYYLYKLPNHKIDA